MEAEKLPSKLSESREDDGLATLVTIEVENRR